MANQRNLYRLKLSGAVRCCVLLGLLLSVGCRNSKKTQSSVDTASDPLMVDTESVEVPPPLNAPALNRGVATNMRDATRFLYTGENAVQKGLDESVLVDARVSVVRGKVFNKDGAPLSGVKVRIHDHAEFGYTLTREDGQFDMVLNGGESVTLDYARPGYLSAQRTTHVTPQDYEWLPDVVMIPKAAKVTRVTSGAGETQVIRGEMSRDTFGQRRTTLLIPPGTAATAVLPDGTAKPLSSLSVRATEFTVGDNGPNAMPGTIPASVGYTYAVDLSIDEADAALADTVTFSNPIAYHVENFLGFPAGTVVPLGYYDRKSAAWMAGDSGVVIDLVKEDGKAIGIDTDGDGVADSVAALSTLGITEAERAKLATLYKPGQSLWRVMIPHFSTWDLNWPFSPPQGAEAPKTCVRKTKHTIKENSCAMPGSIIFPETQVLGESIPLVGTPYTLHCFSDRGASRPVDYTINVPVTGDTLPPSLKAVVLEVHVAGQKFEQRFDAAPNLSYTYVWDGLDAYGRQVQGQVTATVRLGNVYDGSYTSTNRFGNTGDAVITGSRTREEVVLWSEEKVLLGTWDASGIGLGGFSLDVHHAFNPVNQRLIMGDGRQRTARAVPQVATDIADPAFEMDEPDSLVVAPDGRVYFTDDGSDANRVYVINTDGRVDVVAGSGATGNDGDGGLAVAASITDPQGLHLRPDGTLLFSSNDRVRAVSSTGIISTVAGGGSPRDGIGDGLPATQAKLDTPDQLAVGLDGSLYIAELYSGRVRRVDTNGIITTFAGGGAEPSGGLATAATLDQPSGLAIARDGSVYVSERGTGRIVQVFPNGMLSVVVDESYGLDEPRSIAFAKDGALLISDEQNDRIMRFDGEALTTVVGGGDENVRGGVAARDARIPGPDGIALGTDGALYIASDRILKISPSLPGLGVDQFILPSLNGQELFVFDGRGRHLETRDALTQAVVRTFTYNSHGQLSGVTERGGQITLFERNPKGDLTGVTSPTGQRTQFTLDTAGKIATAQDPLNRTLQFVYDSSGLLVSHVDAAGGTHTYTYDNMGLLVSDTGPTGFVQTIDKTVAENSSEISLTTTMGRTWRSGVVAGDDNTTVHQRKSRAGLLSTVTSDDAGRTTQGPDGTVTVEKMIPDVRFQMQVPFVHKKTVTTPGGRELKVTASQRVSGNLEGAMLTSGQRIETVTVEDHTVTRTFDADAKTLRLDMSDARSKVVHYNDLGLPGRIQQTGLPSLSFAYSATGQLTAQTLAAGGETRTTFYTYDSNGYVNAITGPSGETVQMINDAAGRTLQMINGNSDVTLMDYTPLDFPATITPPGRDAHQHQYDGAGLLTAYEPPLLNSGATTTSYAYDADQMPTQTTLPDGRIISQGYDTAGRIKDITVAAGTYSMIYDTQTGNEAMFTTPKGQSVARSYDGPLLTGITWSGPVNGELTFDYDKAFRMDELTVNGGDRTTFEYNSTGDLIRAGSVQITRAPESGIVQNTTIRDAVTSFAYNPFAEPILQETVVDGTPLFSRSYTRDTAGRITRVTESIETDTRDIAYTYDAAGRLSTVTESINQAPATKRTYTYGPNGNRTAFTSGVPEHNNPGENCRFCSKREMEKRAGPLIG